MRRLFWRVYLHGVLSLFVVGAAAVATAWLVDHRPPRGAMERRAVRYLARELRPHLRDPQALQARLEVLHESFEVDLAVYGPDRGLVGAAGAPPPLPPDPPERWSERRRGRFEAGLRVRGSWVVVRGPQHAGGGRFLVAVVSILLALAAVSYPLARRIVRPLERLTTAARRLGEGDLTARSGLDGRDEVGALGRAFDEMAGRLQAHLERERALLADVSHELRTPLARIRVALELCEDEPPGPAGDVGVRRQLSGIRADLEELEALVSDVLAAARLDLGAGEGGYGLRRQPVSVAAVLAEAAERFAALHPQHRLAVEAAPDLPDIEGDPALLRRVLDNLLSNAARHVPREAGPVELRAGRGDDGRVRMVVADRGPGVAPRDLPHLFEPFFRADRSRTRSTGGVGLGLAFCRRVVEAHGGRIDARRREGGGLEMVVELPGP